MTKEKVDTPYGGGQVLPVFSFLSFSNEPMVVVVLFWYFSFEIETSLFVNSQNEMEAQSTRRLYRGLQ